MDIAKLKQAVPLERLVADHVRLRRSGNSLIGPCPFHADKNPSFSVYDNGTKWKCHAGCGGGDQLDFLEKLLGSKEAALQRLRAIAGDRSSQLAPGRVFSTPFPKQEDRRETLGMEQWNRAEARLWESQNAGRAFLERRGITEETARRFHLGYMPDGTRLVAASGDASAEAIRSAPWIGYPYIVQGRVETVKWRAASTLPQGVERFRSQANLRTEALFNQEDIDPDDDLYVVEGEMDAMTMAQAGFRVCGMPSASQKLSAKAREALLNAERIYLAGDNEESGVGLRAMERLLQDLGERAHILLWPRGKGEKKKDANEFFLVDCQGDVNEFRRAVFRLSAEARRPHSPHFRTVMDIIRELRDGTRPVDDPHRLRAPWPSVDKMAIIIPGDIVVVFASQTGTGKSAWVTQLCLHNALQHNRSVLVYTPDLKPQRHTRMVVTQLAHTDRRFLGPEAYDLAASKLRDKMFYLGFDPDARDANHVLDICEQGIRRLGGDILVIDTIHYILRNTREHRVQAIEDVTSRLNAMAAKYGIIAILVAQPRTQAVLPGKARDRWSEIEDIKYGASLREDAAAVIHLHRKRIGEPKQGAKDDFTAEQLLEARTLVRMQKGRDQGEGKQACWLVFKGELAEFQEETSAEPPPDVGREPGEEG